MAGTLDERGRRAEALAWGRGGIAAVARAIGLAPLTIRNGVKELRGRIPTVVANLARLVEPAMRGDPESP